MSTKRKIYQSLSWRVLLANYVGGVGYYAWHFAWIITFFLAMLRVLQFWVFGGDPLLYTPAQTVPASSVPENLGGVTQGIVTVLSVVLCASVAIAVICLPYWVGHVSRELPRWLLRQTSWLVTRRTVHRVKLMATVVVMGCAILLLYYPGASTLTNMGFLVVMCSSLVALTGFVVQYICATLWDIPERKLF